ncbi:MAG: hypothetical protein N2376_03925 [Clostridia bacterium]|nr:hypothetical protein [Clostridia bacterium]
MNLITLKLTVIINLIVRLWESVKFPPAPRFGNDWILKAAFMIISFNENANLIRLGAHTITSCSAGHIQIGIDVSPLDPSGTKKEGVGLSYKKADGYAPILTYMDEPRKGKKVKTHKPLVPRVMA